MKVLMSKEAISYLLKERGYLAARNKPAAKAFVARMKAARENLSRFPQMGFGPERLPIPGVGRLVVGDYLLDYDIIGDILVVTKIIPAAKNVPPLADLDDFDFEADDPEQGYGGP